MFYIMMKHNFLGSQGCTVSELHYSYNYRVPVSQV